MRKAPFLFSHAPQKLLTLAPSRPTRKAMSTHCKPRYLCSLLLSFFAASLLFVAGCAQNTLETKPALPRPASATDVPPPAEVSTPVVGTAEGGFAWAQDALEASGTGTVPPDATTEPQRSLIAKQAAKTAAIANLKTQMSKLSISEERTLGTVMDENIGISHAIERYMQSAQVVSEEEVMSGIFEVRVRLSMAAVAQILEQYHIGAGDNEPDPPSFKSDLSAVS